LGYFSNLKKLLKENNHPIGPKSPHLVTLAVTVAEDDAVEAVVARVDTEVAEEVPDVARPIPLAVSAILKLCR
jgi:hypothetical protein